jgi:hypothetical protein
MAWRVACRLSCASEPKGGGSARVNVLDAHVDSRADARERRYHEANQGAVAQADNRRRVDRVDELARLGRVEHRHLAAPHDVERPAHGGGGIGRHDLAYNHPVEQVAQRSQAKLRGWRGSRRYSSSM